MPVSIEIQQQQAMLIELQAKEIKHLEQDADDMRECYYTILKDVFGIDEYAHTLESYEALFHKLLQGSIHASPVSIHPKTSYRFRTRDVEVRYLKDRWELADDGSGLTTRGEDNN